MAPAVAHQPTDTEGNPAGGGTFEKPSPSTMVGCVDRGLTFPENGGRVQLLGASRMGRRATLSPFLEHYEVRF